MIRPIGNNIKRWIFLILLVLTNRATVYCQNANGVSFVVKENSTYADVLDNFRAKFNVLVAYNPDLKKLPVQTKKLIKGNNTVELFKKLCLSFSLEYIVQDATSFMVRSDFNDLQNDDNFVFHINITDNQTSSPVELVTIYDPTKKYFGFTDEYGDCFIKMPKSLKGTKLIVHSLTHQDRILTIDTHNTYDHLQLLSDPINVDPITVNSLKQKINFAKQQGISIDSVLLSYLSNVTLADNDLLRAVQLLPGVNNTNDASAAIKIRGANEEGTLMILDEMPIYKADHFLGIFGSFNAFYIEKLSLHKNNIPVEYGGKLSGLLKMSSDVDISQFKLKLDANLLNTSLMADLPLSKKVLWKIAARTTYTDLINTDFYDLAQREQLVNDPKQLRSLITSQPSFNFYDLNSRMAFLFGRHTVDINAFLSNDLFDDQYKLTYRLRQNVTVNEYFRQQNKWQNHAFGVNYKFAGNGFLVKANIYKTQHTGDYNINSSLLRRDPAGLVMDSVSILNKNVISDLGTKVSFNVDKWNATELGFEHVIHNNELLIENSSNPVFEVNRVGGISSLFVLSNIGKKDKLQVSPSFRSSYIHFLDKMYFLPQIYSSYNLFSSIRAKASAGRHLQVVRQFEHENPLGQRQQFFTMSNGSSIPVGLSTNYMIGASWSSNRWTLDIEAYHRLVDGVITFVNNAPGLRMPSNNFPSAFRLFRGDGKVRGADMTVIYDAKRYFAMFTYTWSKSENRFNGIFGNQYFPSPEDSRHQVKIFNIFNFQQFSLSLSYTGATGRPYLDLSQLNNKVDRRNLDLTKYIKNLPHYHRVDLGISYKFRILSQSSKLTFSVFNIMDRTNVKYVQFVHQLPPPSGSPVGQTTVLGSEITQLQRTYNLSFGIEIR